MKKLIGCLAVALIAGTVYVFAGTVDPKSNTLGDTDAVANTLVYRDANGVFDAASLEDGTVVTAKLATASVTTAKMWLNLPSGYVPCITTAKRLGYCSTLATTGVCSNCN